MERNPNLGFDIEAEMMKAVNADITPEIEAQILEELKRIGNEDFKG